MLISFSLGQQKKKKKKKECVPGTNLCSCQLYHTLLKDSKEKIQKSSSQIRLSLKKLKKGLFFQRKKSYFSLLISTIPQAMWGGDGLKKKSPKRQSVRHTHAHTRTDIHQTHMPPKIYTDYRHDYHKVLNELHSGSNAFFSQIMGGPGSCHLILCSEKKCGKRFFFSPFPTPSG